MITIKNIAEIINQYNFFIFDLWGVVHDGYKAFSGTLDVFKQLQSTNKITGILSNAPRRVDNTIKRLKELGVFYGEDYQVILTSGEQCYRELVNKSHPFYKFLGKNCYHPGPKRDLPSYDDIPFKRVDHLQDADFRLMTSVLKEDMSDTLHDYEDDLKYMLKRKMPLVCANADKRVLWGKQEIMCIGLIAEEYERRGGPVFVHGKPSITMYQDLHEMANTFAKHTLSKNKILMIGDSLGTDIRGANNYGIDSLLVASGIHGAQIEQYGLDALQPLMDSYQSKPTYFSTHVC